MAGTTLFLAVLFSACLATAVCSQPAAPKVTPTVFVGSTPCDSFIKTRLLIPAATACDFIRWELTLADSAFAVNITYGESEPNTPGFQGGGEKRFFRGDYSVVQNKTGSAGRAVLRCTTEKGETTFSLLKLNDNLLHLVSPAGGLLAGNGGWSYTLNRKGGISAPASLPAGADGVAAMRSLPDQEIFEGRSPCQDFAAEYGITVQPSCFKLKWRLVLNRDPLTHEPTTYTIRKVVDNRPREVTGKWAVTKGVEGSPDAVIYRLDPGKPEETISLLVGDENVLFFLNPKNALLVGNGDFSFTLNKRQ